MEDGAEAVDLITTGDDNIGTGLQEPAKLDSENPHSSIPRSELLADAGLILKVLLVPSFLRGWSLTLLEAIAKDSV